MNKINTDRIFNAPIRGVAKFAFTFISKIDLSHREACGVALAVALLRVCDHWAVEPREFLRVAEHIYRDGEQVSPHFRAVDDFVKNEL